jgi:hypothetical protein
MLLGQKPRQIAYYVPDIRVFAERHSKMFGSGPFFAVDNIKLSYCNHRGKPIKWDHSAAFGQWGDLMVEIMQQNKPGPSVLTDVFPPGSGRNGVHHVAYFVDDPAATVAALEKNGYPLAMHCGLDNGMEVFMVDTVALYGHMTELYAPTPVIIGFYDFVREQSVGFDGKDPVRTISF